MRKSLKAAMVTAALVITASMTAYAGEWKVGSKGWWYQNDDGSYQHDGWFCDADGKYYYFDQEGYLLTNTTTPDNYTVNENGAWVVDGVVQINHSSQAADSSQAASADKWSGYFVADDAQTITIKKADAEHVYLTFYGYSEEGWYTQDVVLTFKNAEKTVAAAPVYNVLGDLLGEDIYTISADGNKISIDAQSFKIGEYFKK